MASSPLDLVAYFSPEFGITEALPQYSGGLGVLAGDHLKASSDLGIPLVGVGLLYAEGYFHQQLNAEGWQEEINLRIDPLGARRAADGHPGERRSRRCRRAGARVACRRRVHPAVPARHERARQPAGSDRCDEPPVRRRRAAPTAPGDRPRHRWRQGVARPRPHTAGVPHERGPCRVPRSGAGPRMDRAGPVVRRSDRSRSRRWPVHHAHAGAGRHRPVPARPVRAVLRHLRQGVRGHLRRAVRARPTRRRARRQVQHGRDGPAARRTIERGRQTPRRRLPRDVRWDVAGAARRPTHRSVTSPTACTPAHG